MFEVIFLICLGLVWIVFATVQDLKHREIANWLNFSLAIFALGFRFFYSLFSGNDFSFFYQGLIGLGIFFVIGNLFYYGRIFAGGDAKLMISLGAIIPLYSNFQENVNIFLVFILLFLLVGAVYGLTTSLVFAFKNKREFSKEFKKQFRKNKKIVYLSLFFGIVLLAIGFLFEPSFYFGVLVFVSSYFYLFAKSVDEACMIKKISVNKVTEGDWLYKDIKIGKKLIKAKWDGLSKSEINLLKKNKREIYIRYGIQFTPVFLISFIILVFLFFRGFFSELLKFLL
jgi:Flp pilus assembly protein protease CpaA